MRSLITGVNGQDGAYLAQLLLDEGCEVYGAYRTPDFWRLDALKIRERVRLIALDVSDETSVRRCVEEAQPDECYSLGAVSFVGTSWASPLSVAEINGKGPVRLLEACGKQVRFYQASTSEMFGDSPAPQSEATSFNPRSPYAAAKLYAHHMLRNYGERGWKIGLGILFNHESPLRGIEFVTRKITATLGAGDPLRLGNVSARRDWGHARDYVRAIRAICRMGGEYVVATGETRSVGDFVDAATRWLTRRGLPVPEIKSDPGLYRPTDVQELCGDPSKILKDLGWVPEIGFEELVDDMMKADCRRVAA